MHIQMLMLENFRTYEHLVLDFHKTDIHLFVGPNGIGKTNLLESISLLSSARSFLGIEDMHMVQWGKNFFRIRGDVQSDAATLCIEVVEEFLPRPRKTYFLNDAKVKVGNMIGRFPTVSFLPQDLNILTGPPALRRRFFDRVLCQTSPDYLEHHVAYARVLKQRNALLRKIAIFPSPGGGGPGRGDLIEELSVWDQKLSSLSSSITVERLSLIQSLNHSLKEKLLDLGLFCENASIVYQRQTMAQVADALQQEFQELLKNSYNRDLRFHTTTIGPHRDDWTLMVDGRPADKWMSRGEQRISIVALFLLVAAYVTDVAKDRPVILLDDVFSELDADHQRSICEHLADCQMLITTTHCPATTMDWKMWEVGRGRVFCPVPVLHK